MKSRPNARVLSTLHFCLYDAGLLSAKTGLAMLKEAEKVSLVS